MGADAGAVPAGDARHGRASGGDSECQPVAGKSSTRSRADTGRRSAPTHPSRHPLMWPSVKFLETWDQGQAMLDCIERGEPWDDEADYSPWRGVIPEMEREIGEGVVF